MRRERVHRDTVRYLRHLLVRNAVTIHVARGKTTLNDINDALNLITFQYFGKGFYFALNSSKSHCYPLGRSAARGLVSEKALLLCKVAVGAVYEANEAIFGDRRPQGCVPGFHSTHYMAHSDCTSYDINKLIYLFY